MKDEIKPYFKGIEEKIIEIISSANSCIYIAVAWFTSKEIKDALITKVAFNKNIDIKIIVDDNHINDKYFFDSANRFTNVLIETKKFTSDFLHNKILLVDGNIIVTGSFNFSKKATKNIENIVVIKSERLYDNYYRIFKFLYDQNYIDDNIQLLFNYPDFARKLISNYYQFSKAEFIKLEKKIEIGECYSYFNGYNDELFYSPGLIFNKSIKYKKINTTDLFDDNYFTSEFELPINKNTVKNWIKSNRVNNTIESFRGYEDLYDLINDEIADVENFIEKYFARKIENCYSKNEIEELIKKNVDIIIEDELWKTNFEPFINKTIINSLFEKLNIIEKNCW